MANLSDYVTESQAAKMLGLAPGKGDAWRHLRTHAPEIALEKVFGVMAVKKSDLQAYIDGRRQRVATRKGNKPIDTFTRQKRRAMLRRLRERLEAR